MMNFKLPACLLFSAISLSACSFAPEYVQPSLDIPQTWTGYDSSNEGLAIRWWQRFNDPVLNSCVESALTNNYDVLIAAEKINQARAYLGVASADLYPNIGGQGQVANKMSSAQPYQDVPPALSFTVPERVQQSYALGFQAAWELDFWGKYRNSTKSAREQLLASEIGQKALLLSLAAQVSHGYFTLRSLDLQLNIAYDTLATREEALRIYKARFTEGLISELDYLRASTEVDTVRTTIYQLQYQIDNAETALLVLMGKSPREVFEDTPERGLALIEMPDTPQLPVGLPSDLLERRPDILLAEAQLRAAHFDIGVAKAAWFPSISLTSSLGLQSTELTDLFKGVSSSWSYGAGLTMPIFNAGKISNSVKASEAAMRAAALNYQQSVQSAFKDIRTSLVIQNSLGNVIESLENTVKSLESAVYLAQLRYDNGYASYLEVLDAERSLFNTEIQLAQLRAMELSSIVNVCLALGGGWVE